MAGIIVRKFIRPFAVGMNLDNFSNAPMEDVKRFQGRILCKYTELNLKTTLTGGQSFRWKRLQTHTPEEIFIGVMRGCVWTLSQNATHLIYQVICNKSVLKGDFSHNALHWERILRDYFRLDINLEVCYAAWKAAHDHFKQTASYFCAVRVLNQELVENLISFLCSQNNHINRITNLVERICADYGKKICGYKCGDYHAFPELEELNVPELEKKLRASKFGYRASYISKAVSMIIEKGGTAWLENLKQLSYKEAKVELMTIPGIGPKVADCICLMSLGHLGAIPVDTHIYEVASLHYLPHLRKTKTITSKAYEEIGDVFRNIYGPFAGWAQTVIFCAELKRFNNKKAGKKK